jgi:hypothetical protein
METAFVIPKSKKAKNRLINLMDSIDEVIVEQNKENSFFVTSLNGRHLNNWHKGHSFHSECPII